MRKLLKRWWFWLGLLLLLGLSTSATLIFASRSPINQANFDLIQPGMYEEELRAILGEPGPKIRLILPLRLNEHLIVYRYWSSGPNWIEVRLEKDKTVSKDMHLATTWESVEWYAKQVAEKIGIR